MPRDRTDSRKENKGQKTISGLNKWDENVKKWKEIANSKGMTVDFEYWGKHELNFKLSNKDNPHFSGQRLFWFHEPSISLKNLKKIANSSRRDLGARYTEEPHLDLPIEKELDGVGLTPSWKKDINRKISELSGLKLDFINKLNSLNNEETVKKIHDLLKKPLVSSSPFCISQGKKIINDNDSSEINIKEEYVLKNRKEILCNTSKILDQCHKLIYEIESKKSNKNNDDTASKMRRFINKVEDIKKFLSNKRFDAAISKSVLIHGEAGIGKSHLLCDISLKRLGSSLPTLFILGQHYEGGDPVDFLLEKLDLKRFSKKEVLGALDAMGETYRSRFLIVLDAINEGSKNEDWYNRIAGFLSQLFEFKNIGLVLSCRDTFIRYIIPSDLEKDLTQIKHSGFRGFEHRAATKYFSHYGIPKPTVPIMTPEFRNPLFVKVCCKALKESGRNSFPRGLRGLMGLFDFYIKSIAKVINRKKSSLEEDIVQEAISNFSEELFPDNLHGLQIRKAQEVINNCDVQSNKNLLNLFIDEGILSLDVDYSQGGRGSRIVRFAYERFSDYFIANHLTKKYANLEDLKSLIKNYFTENQINRKVSQLIGVFQALGVIIPEKYGEEFIDWIPESSDIYAYYFNETFFNMLIFRSSKSFSDRTLKLFNKASDFSHSGRNKMWNVLFSLSTEPDHPWNAYFLNKKLMEKELPERDHFWSIYVASADREEDESQGESNLRTILNWTLNEDLKDVQKERLELTAIVLLWITTCTNQKIRDDATISLARIFAYIPEKISEFIKTYNNVNDPYLTERLYASIYGAVLVQKENKFIKEIANIIYQTVFKENKPYPHILMRDYARGILEYANYKKLLDKNIDLSVFRPPYKSDWPIENPSQSEIDNLEDDELSDIRHSLSSFGDFGKKTMRCVHDWASIPLTEELKTGKDVHLEFANSLSDKDLKSRYLGYISQISSFKKEDLLADMSSYQKNLNDYRTTEKSLKKLIEDIKATSGEERKEYVRWLSGISIDDKPPAFSRKWAQRWVCKKVYDLGWSKKLFGEFEKQIRLLGGASRERKKIERIGKKYQWIAFHELLARMSDNLHWIGEGYSNTDSSKFDGPWQISKRDIDPTFLRTKNKVLDTAFNETWWQSYIPSFGEKNLDASKKWLLDKSIVPPFRDLVRISSKDDKKWIVLGAYWEKDFKHNESGKAVKQDMWIRINSIIINEKDLNSLKLNIINDRLEDPSTVNIHKIPSFFREFFWHPCCHEHIEDDWKKYDFAKGNTKVDYLNPIVEYMWDYSDTSISFYMPSKTLIKELNLSPCIYNESSWKNPDNKIAFMNTNVNPSHGLNYPLMNEELLQKWLNEKGLILVWLIGGEKHLYLETSNSSNHLGLLIYNSFIYYKQGKLICGKTWFP